MTKFNPENREVLTYGECLRPAMEITDQEDADQYLADYVAYASQFPVEGKTALEVCRINLGYFAGYYDADTRTRVNKLFNTAHPVLQSLER